LKEDIDSDTSYNNDEEIGASCVGREKDLQCLKVSGWYVTVCLLHNITGNKHLITITEKAETTEKSVFLENSHFLASFMPILASNKCEKKVLYIKGLVLNKKT
jgi:hypothetical protein